MCVYIYIYIYTYIFIYVCIYTCAAADGAELQLQRRAGPWLQVADGLGSFVCLSYLLYLFVCLFVLFVFVCFWFVVFNKDPLVDLRYLR